MANRLAGMRWLEVTFITKEGAVEIRLADVLPSTIDSAARTLGARYVVATFDWDAMHDCPIWSVYDFSKAQVVIGNIQSLPLPLKTFTAESNDGAVMYAMALAGGGK